MILARSYTYCLYVGMLKLKKYLAWTPLLHRYFPLPCLSFPAFIAPRGSLLRSTYILAAAAAESVNVWLVYMYWLYSYVLYLEEGGGWRWIVQWFTRPVIC